MPKGFQNGMLLMGFAALLFSGMAALAKAAAAQVPSSEVVFFRSLLATFILAALRGKPAPGQSWLGQRKGLLLLRGILGGVALLGFFYGISGLAVADAMLLNQCSPLFVLLLAVPFLGERLRLAHLLVLPVLALGVFFVLRPDLKVLNLHGLAALSSAAFAGGAYICVRKLTRTEPAQLIVFYFAAVSTLISAPLMLSDFVWPEPLTWLALAGVGVLAVGAQLLLTAAYKREQAGKVAMVGTIGPVFAGTWDLLFWGRVPHWTLVLGAALILGSLIQIHRLKPLQQPAPRS